MRVQLANGVAARVELRRDPGAKIDAIADEVFVSALDRFDERFTRGVEMIIRGVQPQNPQKSSS